MQFSGHQCLIDSSGSCAFAMSFVSNHCYLLICSFSHVVPVLESHMLIGYIVCSPLHQLLTLQSLGYPCFLVNTMPHFTVKRLLTKIEWIYQDVLSYRYQCIFIYTIIQLQYATCYNQLQYIVIQLFVLLQCYIYIHTLYNYYLFFLDVRLFYLGLPIWCPFGQPISAPRFYLSAGSVLRKVCRLPHLLMCLGLKDGSGNIEDLVMSYIILCYVSLLEGKWRFNLNNRSTPNHQSHALFSIETTMLPCSTPFQETRIWSIDPLVNYRSYGKPLYIVFYR